jgi:flagellar biosynthesis/type III secretory pathway protein FliH
VQEVHLHLHGVSAEDVAAITGQQQPAARPAIEEDCQRFACRVYREGYRDGYGAGHGAGKAEGHAEGYDEGFTDGMAACPGPHTGG